MDILGSDIPEGKYGESGHIGLSSTSWVGPSLIVWLPGRAGHGPRLLKPQMSQYSERSCP